VNCFAAGHHISATRDGFRTAAVASMIFEDVVRQYARDLYRYAFWLARNRE
jgi:DNA-directed RNA polymerase specialized sigma24 family protein